MTQSGNLKALAASFKNSQLRQWLTLLLGSLFSAVAINVFYLPIKLTMGGITGIVSIIYQIGAGKQFLPFGILYALLNIPLFILGWRHIDARFVWRSVIGTVLYSLMIDFSKAPLVAFYNRYLSQPAGASNQDQLLFCLIGGVLYGVGLGLVFRADFTTGGTDILAMVVHNKAAVLSIGQFVLILDALVIFASAIIYRHQSEDSFLLALYSIIAMSLTSKSVDIVLEGFDYCRMVLIISDRGEEIAARVLAELGRGVTGLTGEGMYTGSDKKILMSVLSRRQIPLAKKIVRQIDPQAFVIVQDAREVMGEGFGLWPSR